MLVLTRKPGESLRIGDDVKITVVASSSGQVRIAIEAPAHVTVHREEVWQRVVAANLEAARVGTAVDEQLAAVRRGRDKEKPR